MSLTIRSVIAVVEKGRLVALRCGEVVAGASISLEGQPLAHGECQPFVAGVLVTLGDSVVLVSGTPAFGPAPGPVPTSAANAQWWQTRLAAAAAIAAGPGPRQAALRRL